jgi:hypothetical protein
MAKTKQNIESLNERNIDLNNSIIDEQNVSSDSAYFSSDSPKFVTNKTSINSKVMTLSGDLFDMKSSNRMSWMSRHLSNYCLNQKKSNKKLLTISDKNINHENWIQFTDQSIKAFTKKRNTLPSIRTINKEIIETKPQIISQSMDCSSTQRNSDEKQIMAQSISHSLIDESFEKSVRKENQNVWQLNYETIDKKNYPLIRRTIQNITKTQTKTHEIYFQPIGKTSEESVEHLVRKTSKSRVKSQMIGKSPRIGSKHKSRSYIKLNCSANSQKAESDQSLKGFKSSLRSTKCSIIRVISNENTSSDESD